MHRIARAPPVVGLALAALAGATLHHLGVPLPWTLLPLAVALRPNPSSSRPTSPHPFLPLALAFLTGGLLAWQWSDASAADCRLHISDGQDLRVRGYLEGRVVEARGQLRITQGLSSGCRVSLRFVLAGRVAEGPLPPPGAPVELRGEWRRGRVPAGGDPIRAGYLRVVGMEVLGEEEGEGGGSVLPQWRGRVQTRLGLLFPTQGALVEALVLARKEGLSNAIRDAFARAGTAHLLAISGFHVGVVAGILLLVGGWLGLSHPLRFLLGSVGVWGYVAFIGFPDAAFRAALILSLLAVGRVLRRPVVALGAIGTAFLILFLLDPGAVLRPGFQLSFAGALGLTVWAEPLGQALGGLALLRGRRVLAAGLAAGISATLATLPLVAWHFGRVSLVGIPLTLLLAPLVTLAIPGIFLSLLLSTLFLPLGLFLAKGVEVDLVLLTRLVEWAASLPLASVWVSRPGVVAGCLGVGVAYLYLRVLPSGPGRRGPSFLYLGIGALSGLLLWPAGENLLHRGTLEIDLLDVGQGDAVAIRSPRGRWILVDAGPRSESFDAGARTVLPFLRRRGAGALDLLVLTHPDMDHVGGAGAVLEGFPVRQIMDPGRVVGSDAFLGTLEEARAAGVPWRLARAGDSLNLDGVALRVLWPPERDFSDNNEASVVIELRFGAFSMLLTGDAPRAVEDAILPSILSSQIQILKVGHHGSSTSTSPELLERLSPDLALISVGRRNRYGHPSPDVLGRLLAAGVEILRTDETGTAVIRARKGGQFEVLRLTRD